MQDQVDKYLSKLQRHGLIKGQQDASLFGLDDEIYTNEGHVPEAVLTLFDRLSINSLMIARPSPVLWAVITALTERSTGLICPCDCESLTFIHDIPVVTALEPGLLAEALNRRKGCIVKGAGIVTTGTVSLEQAFISLSSICFASFVKFFSDVLNGLHGFGCSGRPDPRRADLVLDLLEHLSPGPVSQPLDKTVPAGEEEIMKAMDEAGKAVVDARLVDSFFGNISFREGDTIYISQTGSSLDELPGCIDRVPLDGSSTCEITSSSELLAHVKTYALTGDNAILHGHPRFSVIMSMIGETLEFGRTRFIGDVPVVSGEVGAGSRGLAHTLPPAMQGSHCAIVSGHGTFTSCTGPFAQAFERLGMIEELCFNAYREEFVQAL